MEENKNVEATEVKESTKKEATKQIQKNFKFSSEEEKNEINEIIAALTTEQDEKEKTTDGFKILRALRSVINDDNRNKLIETTENQKLATMFAGAFVEVELMQRRVTEKFERLMESTNYELDEIRKSLTNEYEKKIAKLEKEIERLEKDLEKANETKEATEVQVKEQTEAIVSLEEKVKSMNDTLIQKDKEIALLENQAKTKDTLVEETKTHLAEANNLVSQMRQLEQVNMDKIEALNKENKELSERYSMVNQDNRSLTYKLKQKDMEIEFSNKEKVRLESDLVRVRAERDEAQDKVEQSLVATRSLEEKLRNQMMLVMSNLATQQTPTTTVEEEGSKDSQTRVAPTTKPSVVVENKKTKNQATSNKKNMTYQLINEDGKEVFRGTWNGLVRKANAMQKKAEVTIETEVSEIEKLLSPCVIKVIKK